MISRLLYINVQTKQIISFLDNFHNFKHSLYFSLVDKMKKKRLQPVILKTKFWYLFDFSIVQKNKNFKLSYKQIPFLKCYKNKIPK